MQVMQFSCLVDNEYNSDLRGEPHLILMMLCEYNSSILLVFK